MADPLSSLAAPSEKMAAAGSTEIDLLEKMLDLDPETRITTREALKHSYLEEYHDSDPDPAAEKYDDSFESLDLAIKEWKSLSHMEIMTFDPKNPRQTAI